MHRGLFRGCVAALALCVVSLPLVPAGLGAAAAAGPEVYDVRRGATYAIQSGVEAGCDADPAQDLELEWDGTRIAWESIELSGTPENNWRLYGIYRVPGNAEPGWHSGIDVYCWDREHVARHLIFNYVGGAIVYDARVAPVDAPAGSAVVIDGQSLPAHCGDPDTWSSRLSIRFDGQPRPWTSITGTMGEHNNPSVTVNINVPAGASTGRHEWSIWCQHFDASIGYARLWERTVQVIVAPPPPPPPPGAVASATASGRPPSGSPSPSTSATPSPSDAATVPETPSPATVVTTPAAAPQTDAGTTAGWPRTKVISAIPRSSEIAWQNPWLIIGLLLLAALLFLLIGFPSELFNKTFEENEPAIRRWLRLPPKRDHRLHQVRWPIVAAFIAGCGVLMALAEPSPIFSRETLITLLALLVAVPVTALGYQFVMERHARRSSRTSLAGKLKPLYPAIIVAVVCALLSRVLHFVPGYVYGLVIVYAAVRGRTISPKQEGIGVLKATATLFVMAMLSWIAWQIWFADATGTSASFVMRWLDTVLGYIALLGLEAPLLGLLPLRFMDGQRLWRWSKPLWLTAYWACVTAFVIVLMDLGNTSSDWSDVITMLLLFVGFGLASFAFWAVFAIRARRLALYNR